MVASPKRKIKSPVPVGFVLASSRPYLAHTLLFSEHNSWEDPTFIHPDAENCRGDNDPLDVCEIGARICRPGVSISNFAYAPSPCCLINIGTDTFHVSSLPLQFIKGVRPVKVLGILCMIDEGECDWKVVAIDAEDKWAPFLNDIDDVERELPGLCDAIREWYRTYKIPDGKPPNVFGLDEKFMDKAYAKEVIDECHHAWEMLISGDKERQIESQGDEVKDLVRNLSKHSLFTLAGNLDEHTETRDEDFGEEESGALFF